MIARDSLISELEDSIRSGSREKRADCLRNITNLFLATADRLNDEQIEVFDEVVGRLVEHVEMRALSELSQRIAPIPNAPAHIIMRLASNDEIMVARPVLEQSSRLTMNDLIEIASKKSQAHLFAISCRKDLDVPITDVLVQRGEREVLLNLAQNPSAIISESGYTALVRQAEKDETLAEKLGFRLDIPLRIFRQLLTRAAQGVRDKLIARAPLDGSEIQAVQAQILSEIRAMPAQERDYSTAHRRVMFMYQKNELNDESVLGFVRSNKHEELVVALAVACSVPFDLIDRLMRVDRNDALLIPCKIAGYSWPTVKNILRNRPAARTTSDKELEQIAARYTKLSRDTAQRVFRFWQVRDIAQTG